MSKYGMISASTDLFSAFSFCVLCTSVMCVFGENNKTDGSTILNSEPKFNASRLSEKTECISKKQISETTSINQTSYNNSSDQNSESELTEDDKNLFSFLKEHGLYYSLSSIMDDINAHQFKTGIIDLMSVHNRSEWISKMRKNYQARDQIKKKKRMIFINIETVYSSKREMITKGVARRLRGKQMTSPPKFMADIRVILGPGSARKLYYSITKYSTAHHIQQALNTHAVVLERYWLHHAAFIMSKVFNDSSLPPQGHPIYKWPKDLMKPDIVFFVNATKTPGEDTGFAQPYTSFTDRLITVFRRVEGVNVVELNPCKNFHNIVKEIISYLKEHFKNHPDIMVPNLDLSFGNPQRQMLYR